MKNKILLLLIFISLTGFAQKKTCNTPKEEELIVDMNSITKCTVSSSKNASSKGSQQIKVRVSASKARFLKKRIHKKRNLSKHKILSISSSLSKEEVKLAKRFSHVEKVPVFKKCSKFEAKERLTCFNKEMVNHINTHFQYPSDAIINKIEGEVWVRFVVDKQGNITNVKANAPKGCEILHDEALRVIYELPKFTPGKDKGKPVLVKYGFPINFSLSD